MSAEEKVTLLSKLPRAQDRAHRLDFRRLLLGLHSREDTRVLASSHALCPNLTQFRCLIPLR